MVALMLPALSGAKEAGRRVKCMSNLHQMSIGMATYNADFVQRFPITPYMVLWGNAGSGDQYSLAHIPSNPASPYQPPQGPNPNGWYQIRAAKYIPEPTLICPSMAAMTGELTVGEQPTGTLTPVILDYGYRYNNFEIYHELPQQNNYSGAPGTYPREPQDTRRVLFIEAASYKRNAAQNIILLRTSYLRQAWPHIDGGNVVTFGGSAHWLPNELRSTAGVNIFGAWPTSSYTAPYAKAAYGVTNLNIDLYLRERNY